MGLILPLAKVNNNFKAHLFYIALFFPQQDGMTPLMQAAYKGKHEICQLLIEKGANVNYSKHEHKVLFQPNFIA